MYCLASVLPAVDSLQRKGKGLININSNLLDMVHPDEKLATIERGRKKMYFESMSRKFHEFTNYGHRSIHNNVPTDVDVKQMRQFLNSDTFVEWSDSDWQSGIHTLYDFSPIPVIKLGDFSGGWNVGRKSNFQVYEFLRPSQQDFLLAFVVPHMTARDIEQLVTLMFQGRCLDRLPRGMVTALSSRLSQLAEFPTRETNRWAQCGDLQ